jgi:hypothetical protein
MKKFATWLRTLTPDSMLFYLDKQHLLFQTLLHIAASGLDRLRCGERS